MRTWESRDLHPFITLLHISVRNPQDGHSCPVGCPQLAQALPHVEPFLQRDPRISLSFCPVCAGKGEDMSVCPCLNMSGSVTAALGDKCNPPLAACALLKLQNHPS